MLYRRKTTLLVGICLFFATIIGLRNRTYTWPLTDPVVSRRAAHQKQCPSKYGDIATFIAVKFDIENGKEPFPIAIETMKCYAERASYELFYVNLLEDNVTANACDSYSMEVHLLVCNKRYEQWHFKNNVCSITTALDFYRHFTFVVTVTWRIYMLARPDIKWWLFMDADIMVVNPNRCIEEYIDTEFDITFYERFRNLEIATGGIMYKNYPRSQNFLLSLADYEFKMPKSDILAWSGHDNGTVHVLLAELVFSNETNHSEIEQCRAKWSQSANLELYYEYTRCCRMLLGTSREWNSAYRLMHRAHGWVMDIFTVGWKVSEFNFMTHGVKSVNMSQQPIFETLPTGAQCESNGPSWNYLPEVWLTGSKMKSFISTADSETLKLIETLDSNAEKISTKVQYRIAECYPNCPMHF